MSDVPQDDLDTLRRIARRLGRTPGAQRLDAELGCSLSSTLVRRYGTYKEACRAAGLQPNVRQGGRPRLYSREDVLHTFTRMVGELGHMPTLTEYNRLRATGEPSSVALRKRYGSWGAVHDDMLTTQLELRRERGLAGREKNGVAA